MFSQSTFFEILRFELRQQLRAPLFWIVALAFGALAFALTSTDAVVLGGASGNVLRNAPLVIVRLLSVLTVLSIFLVTIFVAAAALRDFDQRTSELFFATPMSRGAYLGGRFAAGYVASLAIMLVCALGLALGNMMPWIDAARMGPADWHGYAWAFGVMVVPDMLFIAALLYLLATTTRSLLATYVGVIVYFVLQGVVGQLTKDVNNHYLAAMLDPFGGRTLAIITRYWSADQSNHALPALTGVLLFNRLLWVSVSVAMLGATALALLAGDFEFVEETLGALERTRLGEMNDLPVHVHRSRILQQRSDCQKIFTNGTARFVHCRTSSVHANEANGAADGEPVNGQAANALDALITELAADIGKECNVDHGRPPRIS